MNAKNILKFLFDPFFFKIHNMASANGDASQVASSKRKRGGGGGSNASGGGGKKKGGSSTIPTEAALLDCLNTLGILRALGTAGIQKNAGLVNAKLTNLHDQLVQTHYPTWLTTDERETKKSPALEYQ